MQAITGALSATVLEVKHHTSGKLTVGKYTLLHLSNGSKKLNAKALVTSRLSESTLLDGLLIHK